MGITLYTSNALSSISEPDGYSPGFDTTSLRRAEIFTYTGIGQNLMPGETFPTVVGTPSIIDGTPYVLFSNNASEANLNLGIQDGSNQTWFVLFDPNSDNASRLVMSSYGGTSASALPGAGIMINGSGALQLGVGYHNTSNDTYSVALLTLTGFDFSKPALLCVTLTASGGTITNLTSGASASVSLSAGQVRAPNTLRVGKGAVALFGSSTAKNRIAAYLVFDRVLSSSEMALVRSYLLRCIQAKFPSLIF